MQDNQVEGFLIQILYKIEMNLYFKKTESEYHAQMTEVIDI